MNLTSHNIVNALIVARAANGDIIGNLHSLYYCGKSMNETERAHCLHKARESAEQLLVAILKAEQEVAPVASVSAPVADVIRIGDHDPELRRLEHDLCLVAAEMGAR